eukprot:GHVR01121814.1.p1 GENE.GHVR01121814.1~~GHVR01121814.1.p1  ORF type:complete len:357 (+),score=67.15 GHVR01121814.1:45-1115(+)
MLGYIFIFIINLLLLTLLPISVYASDDFTLKWTGNVYVLADIHGDYETTINLLYKINIIDNNNKWIGVNTLLIQLGDILDVGTKGKQLIDLFIQLREDAINKNSKVLLLMGNHEYWAPTGIYSFNYRNHDKSFINVSNKISVFSSSNSNNSKYRDFLKSLKLAVIVNDSLYVHGGMTPNNSINRCNDLDSNAADFVENCLRKLNEIMLHNLPDIPEITLYEQKKRGFFDIFYEKDKEIREGAKENPLFHRPVDSHKHKGESRTYETSPELDKCKHVSDVLEKLKAKRMIVGHTANYYMRTYCDNTLVMADSLVSRWYRSIDYSATIYSIDGGTINPHYVNTKGLTPEELVNEDVVL